MKGLGPDVVSVVGPPPHPQGLTVEFLTLRYSFVYTVESLSLFYLLLYLDLSRDMRFPTM